MRPDCLECHNPKNPGSDADANSLNLKRVKGLAQRRSLAFEEGVFTGEEEDELVGALCLRCMCFLRSPVRAALYVHLSHAYGFSPVWVRMWLSRLLLRAALYVHLSHAYSFSPVWVRM